ncbi:hypothetical protein [Dyadobacter sp. 32]|uniref:hypothetical protein n=1 Tax=Dyadobacter sp. 32 TaxID=538966 RepID=UPI0011EF1CED
MKNYVLLLVALVFLMIAPKASAQDKSTTGLLDKAMALFEKGDHAGTAQALTEGTAAIETEAKSSNGALKDKLLSKVGSLKSMIPLVSAGKLQSGILGKAINAVKMLIGSNRISGLLGKGESGLLGNAASLTSSLGLIKAGSSILGSDQQTSLNKLLGEASKTSGEVDKKGVAGKVAATAASKQLGSIVKLVSSAL